MVLRSKILADEHPEEDAALPKSNLIDLECLALATGDELNATSKGVCLVKQR